MSVSSLSENGQSVACGVSFLHLVTPEPFPAGQHFWRLDIGVENGDICCVISDPRSHQVIASFGCAGSSLDAECMQKLQQVVYEQVSTKGKRSSSEPASLDVVA
jgi:hypothetical protein